MPTTLLPTDLRAQLRQLARDRRSDLCARCAGSATNPCARCAHQRQRILTAHRDGLDAVVIAVQERLPKARVERILEEQLDRAAQDPNAAAELLAEDIAQALADDACVEDGQPVAVDHAACRDLADHAVQCLEAGDPRSMRAAGVILGAAGWPVRTARLVLAGSHIPNRTLRNALLGARARVIRGREAVRNEVLVEAGLTSIALARRTGLYDDSHFDRVLGLRPDSAGIKTTSTGEVRRYGGTYRVALAVGHAMRIAEALELSPADVPGL